MGLGLAYFHERTTNVSGRNKVSNGLTCRRVELPWPAHSPVCNAKRFLDRKIIRKANFLNSAKLEMKNSKKMMKRFFDELLFILITMHRCT